jgi:hypothetical protein
MQTACLYAACSMVAKLCGAARVVGVLDPLLPQPASSAIKKSGQITRRITAGFTPRPITAA